MIHLKSIIITPRTILIPRSTGQFLPTQYHKNQFIENEDNSIFSWDINTTYRFEKSNNSKTISLILFGSNTLLFQVSSVQRSSNALIVEHFRVSPNSSISLNINPHIANQIIDIQASFTKCSFWIQGNIPITFTKFNFKPYENGFIGTTNIDGASINIKNNRLENTS